MPQKTVLRYELQTTMPEIIPAIIPESLEDLEKKLKKVKGLAPLVQIDLTDGKFVPNLSWPFAETREREEFQKIVDGLEGLPYWKDFDFEADLMITKPQERIEDWVRAGFTRVIVHYESTECLDEIIERLSGQVEIGIALNIDTPNERLDEYLSRVDFIQCMGIAKIGFQREEFDERVIPKITHFKESHPNVILSVDGGVNFESAKKLKEAGVDRLVSGSSLFDAPNIRQAISEFGDI